jgi:hydrogenase nickel incorporation protein HypA/HybF
MHEVGLVEGIVETVRQRAGDRPVARVRVRIGTLHHAPDGPMEQAFEMVVAGTELEGATLELIQLPVTSTCQACGQATTGPDRDLSCPACGSIAMAYSGGDELILESIEYRAAEVAAASPTAI